MSTQFSYNGEMVATRFFNGTCSVVQFEVTQVEFADWKDAVVEGDDGSQMTVADVAASAAVVHFDNAARQNAMARDFASHRFADQVFGMNDAARNCSQRARDVSRQMFTAV